MALTRRGPEALPPIAFAFPRDTPPPVPEKFKPVANLATLNRPESGLWCAPVTSGNADGTPKGTAWTDWCDRPNEFTGQPHLHHVIKTAYSEVVRVVPLPGTRIYRIDTAADLDRLVKAYRLPQAAGSSGRVIGGIGAFRFRCAGTGTTRRHPP